LSVIGVGDACNSASNRWATLSHKEREQVAASDAVGLSNFVFMAFQWLRADALVRYAKKHPRTMTREIAATSAYSTAMPISRTERNTTRRQHGNGIPYDAGDSAGLPTEPSGARALGQLPMIQLQFLFS
jgi:hypothetical protein